MTQQRDVVYQDRSEMNVLFVHSAVDDLGLSMAEFRVYAHLCRRAGLREAWPSFDGMAKVCCICVDTVKTATKKLIEKRLIKVTKRPGMSNIYVISKPSDWTLEPPRKNPPGLNPTTGKNTPDHPPEKYPPEGDPVKVIHSKSKGKTPDAPLPEIPEGLKCPEFEAAWSNWQNHRREIKKKMTPTAANQIFKKCLELGVQRSVSAIEFSIGNGWQGIFEEKRNQRNNRVEVLPSKDGAF